MKNEPTIKTLRFEAAPPRTIWPIPGEARRVRVMDTNGAAIPATVTPFKGDIGGGPVPQRIITVENISGPVVVEYLEPHGRGRPGHRQHGPDFAKGVASRKGPGLNLAAGGPPKISTKPGRQGGEWRGALPSKAA